jgi:pimeloyl-ACP methyl ester carboxylesterase
VVLDGDFLDKIINDENKGVLMIEGAGATTSPLVLEIWNSGTKICENELPLSIDGVEKMYRWINLRPGQQNDSRTGPPQNNPDTLTTGTNVLFLHGFAANGVTARGWNAEIFKRLYQSGSRAKFWGMTWEGDVGLVDALHYQEDVANALAVAFDFYAQVQPIAGDKVVLAHSLGNMVVSAAIQDYGLNVSKYFMLNAAVATECYDPAAFNDATNDNYMLHEGWPGYSSKTWCSTWFRLFSSPDDRAKLTWQARFTAVPSVACNFYSSGDEIFQVYPGTPGLFTGGPFHLEQCAWQKQEMFKGLGGLGGTDWAGWGFSGEYTMLEANAAMEDNLRTNAVFRQEPTTMFTSNITTQGQNDIIAQGVPALSYAAGVTNALLGFDKNYDVNTHKQNGWGRSGSPYYDRWLHSDLKNMAYLYTYGLFNELVSRGGLQ